MKSTKHQKAAVVSHKLLKGFFFVAIGWIMSSAVTAGSSAPAVTNGLDNLPDSAKFAELCNADGEFALEAKYWNGGLNLYFEDTRLSLKIEDGVAKASDEAIPPGEGVISFEANREAWEKLLRPVPPRYYTQILGTLGTGNARLVDTDELTLGQFYPPAMRAIELLRPADPALKVADEKGKVPRFDSPVGRYIWVNVLGQDYRIYYEEAGEGVPFLLQHTAGSHGTQYRHLFENKEITSKYRLIAYDLPYHGKSMPPVDKAWWTEQYMLTAEFARAFPRALADALKLERPVFMGSSMGGMLALDLAYHHPKDFRAVISLQGALNIPAARSMVLKLYWHPQVGNHFKSELMHTLMSPTAPLAYRKEVEFIYAQGWPQLHRGDINYYSGEYDLRGKAQDIDTGEVAVYIMTGEYDTSGTLERGEEAHKAIKGSKFIPMPGLGHFPMTEDPEAFIGYLMPVLDEIAGNK